MSIELIDVEAKNEAGETVIVKTVKKTVVQPDHVEYATKEQLEAVKAQLTEKLANINSALALFPK